MEAEADGRNQMAAAELDVGRLFWVTHEAIIGADLETERIVLWNPSAQRIFGYAPEEALGMRLDRLVPDALVDAHHVGIRRYREGETAHLVGGPPIEVPAVTKGGEQLTIALTLTAVEAVGERRHVVAVVRDVTAQKVAEDERQRMFESMQAFVATASHDLRTPLTTVMGYARMLFEQGDDIASPKRTEFAGVILRAGERASLLVDDLLTLSKIQAGVVDVRQGVVELAELARDAVADAGVNADVAVPAGVSVFADKDHLRRMVSNLVVNASKYGEPPITVSAAECDDHVEVKVHDAGAGVAEDFVASLFEPFSRAEASRAQQGTGLGLSIVKGLAEANGGSVRYAGVAGEGACFIISVPNRS